MSLARDLLEVLEAPFALGTTEVVTAASIGVVEIGPGTAPAELLRQADLAMYRAKARGGGGFAVYDVRMSEAAARRLQVEAGLRESLRDDRTPLHYQPVFELDTGRMVLAEALLRLDLPDLGLLGPEEVVRVATETGMIHDLGRVVAETAAQAAAGWPGDLAVSVNVSPHQLRDRHLPRTVDRVLTTTGLEPSRLVLELTEEALLDDPDHAARMLRACRRSGVRIALDDFGRGWSSLATLRTLPIDVLKLDRSLLDDIPESAQARAVVQAVLGVADALALDVVAEGIETTEQLRISRELGCALGQGYLLARPGPEAALDGGLAQPRTRG